MDSDAFERPEIHKPDPDELASRLADLAGRQEDSRLAREPSLTPPPDGDALLLRLEIPSRAELIRQGGRPACSVAELPEDGRSCDAVLPWLTDDPGTNIAMVQKSTVFSRQLFRWFDFRKSQLVNRAHNIQDGFPAFLSAKRAMYEGVDEQDRLLGSTFNETTQNHWQGISARQHLPGDQPFSSYKDQLRNRLKQHAFARPIRLHDDPRRQDNWTTWLEYLNFEEWHLEQLTARAVAEEPQFHKSWNLLSETSHRCGPEVGGLAIQPKTNKTGRAASNKASLEFIKETIPYKNALTATRYQRLRVKWIIKEARLLEGELSEQRPVTADVAKRKADRSKKRGRDEDDESSSNDAKRVAVDTPASGAVGNGPGEQGRRRSARLGRTGG